MTTNLNKGRGEQLACLKALTPLSVRPPREYPMLCQVESLGIRQVCRMASNMVPCTSISTLQELLVHHRYICNSCIGQIVLSYPLCRHVPL